MDVKELFLDQLNTMAKAALGELYPYVKVKWQITNIGEVSFTIEYIEELDNFIVELKKGISGIADKWQASHITELYTMVAYNLAKGRIRRSGLTITECIFAAGQTCTKSEELIPFLEKVLYEGQPLLSEVN